MTSSVTMTDKGVTIPMTVGDTINITYNKEGTTVKITNATENFKEANKFVYKNYDEIWEELLKTGKYTASFDEPGMKRLPTGGTLLIAAMRARAKNHGFKLKQKSNRNANSMSLKLV